MFNAICSPEMEFKSHSDQVPHAFVNFDDVGKSKEIIPLTYVKKFPSDWRVKGWDKRYLFGVFYSPDDEETPQTMLRKVAEIPQFERGSAFAGPGYYRAAVVAVKESKQELDDFMDEKRRPVNDLTYSYTSFDNPKIASRESGSNAKTIGKSSKEESKNASSSNGKLGKIVKGINLKANQTNTEELSRNLRQKSKVDNKDKKTDSETVTREVPPVVPRNKRSGSKHRKREHSSSNSETEGKKFDPDFTPQKYEEVKSELLRQKAVVLKLSNLNQRLQENLLDSSEQNSKLGSKIASLEAEVRQLNEEKLSLEAISFPLKEVLKTPVSKVMSRPSSAASSVHSGTAMKDTHLHPSHTNDSGLQIENSFSDKAISSPLKEDLETPVSEVTSHPSPAVVPGHSGISGTSMEDTHRHPSPSNESGLQTEIVSSNEDCVSPSKFCEVVEDNVKSTTETALEVIDGNLLLVPGVVVEKHLKDIIFGNGPGVRKDLPFTKQLVLCAYGPGVLASHTVKGTAKGGRKRSETEEPEPRTKKPKLDENILKACRAQLINRVEREEGCSLNEIGANCHERTKEVKFSEYVRQLQTSLRRKGYGVGAKSNELPKDLRIQ